MLFRSVDYALGFLLKVVAHLQDLKTLVLPHQITLKAQIDEAVDPETIKRRLEAKEADPHEYTKYFIDMMASLCAQCRDEDIAKLRTTADPSECFR